MKAYYKACGMVAVALVIALSGCGKDKKAPGLDWSGKELKPVKNKVKGIDFTISLPDGMKLEDPNAEITLHWKADMDDYFSEPGVAVSFAAIPASTLDKHVERAMLDDTHTIAKKQEIEDGFLLAYHTKNKGIVKVSVLKKKGDTALQCRASQAKQGGVPSPDKTMAWLEKICLSLTF